MIDPTILLVTAAMEVGLAWGYGMRWFLDLRLMFLSFAEAVGSRR
jgi:hypothetical protein